MEKNNTVSAVININKVKVDEEYQRTRELKGLHKKIRNVFSWEAFGRPIIGQREGKSGKEYYIIDGQQRIIALKELGYNGDIPVVFVPDSSRKVEADVFVSINSDRASVTPIEKFKAAVTAGHPVDVEIDNFIKSLGVCVSDDSRSMNKISFISTVRKRWIQNKEAAQVAMRECINACAGSHIHGCIFRAYFFLSNHGCKVDGTGSLINRKFGRDEIVKRVYTANSPRWLGNEKCFADSLLLLINHGRRNKMEMNP